MEAFIVSLNKVRNEVAHQYSYNTNSMNNLVHAAKMLFPREARRFAVAEAGKEMLMQTIPFVAGHLKSRREQFRFIYLKGVEAFESTQKKRRR
jgi:hypothetical protein